MSIRKRIVSKDADWDFGDYLSENSSLSRLDILAIVAEKVYEREIALSQTLFLGIPMAQEQFTPSLPKLKKIGPKPEIPVAMVGDEATASKPGKRNRASTNPVGALYPVLPQEFRDMIFSMGGTDPVMVMRKKLYKCDVDKNQGRITMPKRECGEGLSLSEKEKELLEVRDGRNKLVGIRVKVIDPGLRERELSFKKWEYNKTANFVLVSNWNEVVVDNKLKVEDYIQIWAFRIEGELAFALVKLSGEFHVGKSSEAQEQSSFGIEWGAKR